MSIRCHIMSSYTNIAQFDIIILITYPKQKQYFTRVHIEVVVGIMPSRVPCMCAVTILYLLKIYL